MNTSYRDTIWKMILESPLENKGKISEQRKEQYKRKKELKLMGSEDIKI